MKRVQKGCKRQKEGMSVLNSICWTRQCICTYEVTVPGMHDLYKIKPVKIQEWMGRAHEVPSLFEELLAVDDFWEREVSFL